MPVLIISYDQFLAKIRRILDAINLNCLWDFFYFQTSDRKSHKIKMEENMKKIPTKRGTFQNFNTNESEEMGRNVAFIEPVDEVLVVQPPKPNTTEPQNGSNSSNTTETAMEIDGNQVINSPSPKPEAKPYRLNLRRFESAPCGQTSRS